MEKPDQCPWVGPVARSFITRAETAPEFTACPPLSSLNKLLQQQETQLTTQTLLTHLFYDFNTVTQRGAHRTRLGFKLKAWIAGASPGSALFSPSPYLFIYSSRAPRRFSPRPDHKPINIKQKETLAWAGCVRRYQHLISAWNPAAHNNRRQIPRGHK